MLFYDKEFLGKKFKEYRKLRKMTQEELSEKISIAEKHYGKLERGTFSPSLETFFKLIDVLNIPLSEFGVKLSEKNNSIREQILKEIYLSNENELELYLNLIKSVKKFNNKK